MTTYTNAAVPGGHKIDPRPIKVDLEQAPRYWFDQHPFKTFFHNALVTTFPAGENFFVRSVAHFRGQVADPQLQQQINAFISQEGNHAHAHDVHCDILERQGFRSIKFENKLIDRALKRMNRRMPKFALATTVALEHFTAMLAHLGFEREDVLGNRMDPQFAALLRWHAAEEIEHKAVAFDVYQAVDGSYWRRVIAMAMATFSLTLMVPLRVIPLLWVDGYLFSGRQWREGLAFLYGREGLFILPLRHYLEFYRRDFHPWQIQDYHMIEHFATQEYQPDGTVRLPAAMSA
jgi:predicted metal-dependent hydrolase